MRWFCDTITNELTVAKMRRALAPFHNIDLPAFRLAAYEQAGISSEAIIEHDADAYRLELIRRTTKPATIASELVEIPLTIAGLVLFVGTILLMTPGV